MKEQISNQKLIQISNKIGDLVISSGLSYNQAKKVFDITLEALNVSMNSVVLQKKNLFADK